MKLSYLIVLLALFAVLSYGAITIDENSSSSQNSQPLEDSIWFDKLLNRFGGGFGPNFKCYGCTAIVTAMVQYTTLNEIDIDDFLMNDFCKFFGTIKPACQAIVNQYGAALITSLLHSASPDQACRDINVCTNPQCNLNPQDRFTRANLSPNWPHYVERYYPQPNVPPTKWLDDLVNKLSDNTPTFDVDGDYFSATESGMRGYNWRGRDCNDLDASIHPGRKVDPYPGAEFDYNCNGISGKDPSSGEDYKSLFCDNTNQLGVLVMGDSAGAHCEIPAAWFNGSAWNSTVFANIVSTILDEVDLPHMSGYTGYFDQGNTGPVRSVYKNLYEKNKCNFRDYLNIAVNGASSVDTLGNIQVLKRDPVNDHPLLIFLELIGNDICDWQPGFDTMTTPEQFQANILQILDYIDTAVPAGSHLVVLGLVNGSMVYEGVANHTHPLGVQYSKLFDYQNCLEASFCWGWLNTNQTVRDLSTQRAMELNQVWQSVLSNYTAKNFDLIYYDFPAKPIWDEWVANGGDPYELIEPADGFHPNQQFHALLGDYLWNNLQKDRPQWLGSDNPNNDNITQVFGNQGGY